MTECPTVQAIKTQAAGGKSSRGDPPQPGLCMTWAVDPVTGKLVARWIAKRAGAAESVALSSAA
jgi:hypothetical protein